MVVPWEEEKEEIWCSQISFGEVCRHRLLPEGETWGRRGGGEVLCISTHSKSQRSDEKRPFVNDWYHKNPPCCMAKGYISLQNKADSFLMSQCANAFQIGSIGEGGGGGGS